jgi:LPS sulfotransferase NodH
MVPPAVAAVSGDHVVVDSSKSPTRVAMLAASGLDVSVVHLVRDPRAIAWSWRRSARPTDEAHPFTPRTTAAAAVEWTANNAAIEAVVRRTGVRYVRVRYEDLVDEPVRTLASIADVVGAELDVPIAGSTATIAPNHTVAGNPSRFRTGSISLQRDDEWRARLSPADRRLTTAVTLPLLRRYRYRIRTT